MSGVDGSGVVWHRMHPFTPVLGAWRTIAALFFLAIWQVSPRLTSGGGLPAGQTLLAIGGLLLAGAAIGAVYAAIAWRVTRYALDDERVYYQSGVLFRRHRQARLDRVQAVDVIQPLFARLFGLAQLRVEQAGGSDSNVDLAYLTEADAQALRNEILARAAGVAVETVAQTPTGLPPVPVPPEPAAAYPPPPPAVGAAVPPPPSPPAGAVGPPPPPPPSPVSAADAVRRGPSRLAPEAPEHEVLSVPVSRVLGSIALSGTAVMVVLAVVLVVVSVVFGTAGGLGAVFMILIVAGSYVWGRFSGEFAFRAAISPDGIRLRHGLTESRAQTVPPGRVQAVRLVQPLLWRPAGWWRVRINVAGYGANETAKESVLLPVGTRDEALLALWLVLPELGEPDPRAILEAGLAGSGEDGAFVPSPRRARWLDPVAWRRNGLRVTPAGLLLRSGRLARQLDLVPHERTQSIGLTQGPLQRQLGLSSFVVHSTSGPVTPRVQHLDTAVAADFLMVQAERARTARANAGPERWMTRSPQDLNGPPSP